MLTQSPTARIRHVVFNGMPQAEFAAIAGVNQATVSRWENGDGNPSLDHISRWRHSAIQSGLPWNDEILFAASEQGHAA